MAPADSFQMDINKWETQDVLAKEKSGNAADIERLLKQLL